MIEPTPEQFEKGSFERAGMAYRRKPVIDSMFAAGKLSEAEYRSLAYYRDQAHRAEDDQAGGSVLAPEKIMGGIMYASPFGGFVPASLLFTPAIAETGRIERDLGSLLDIARAIAVDDTTLTQWCIEKHGGRERYNGKGQFVAIVPIAEKRHIELARLELRMAARRISM